MTPTTAATYRIPDDILGGLRTLKTRDGIPISEQVRRALRAWLESKGIHVETAPRRADTRRRA